MRRTTGLVPVGARRGDRRHDIPWIALQGESPRPLVAVTANIHGDECTGIGVVHALIEAMAGRRLKGSLLLYPTCNPQGLAVNERRVPADDADLNRMFPGNARGSWSARIAHGLWHHLLEHDPDCVIDLHADAPDSIPYVLVDRPVRRNFESRKTLAARLTRLADATGLTVVREYLDEVYIQFGLDRSLAGAVVNVMGTPAVTIECGPRRRLDPEAIATALKATLGVLDAIGLIEEKVSPDPSKVTGVWRRSSAPRARYAGLLVPRVAPGRAFSEGEVLAEIHGLEGECRDRIVASEDGIVLSWSETCWVTAGGVLGTIGVSDGEHL